MEELGTRPAERQERFALELADGCTVGAFEEAWGAPWEDRVGSDVGPNHLVVHLQVVGGSIVAQVTEGEEAP